FTLNEVLSLWREFPGVRIVDDPASGQLPTPLIARGNDWVWVGRVRGYRSRKRLSFFIASDNLRKGAATNAIHIAEYLVKEGLVKILKYSPNRSSASYLA
ncbi:MAG: Asd/ArgC dimerization domain-containing protein, partial [bacterium]